MKPKTTLILLAVAAILFAYIWFKERQLPSTEDRSSRAKRVFDIKSDDITKLQVQLNTSNYVGRKRVEPGDASCPGWPFDRDEARRRQEAAGAPRRSYRGD
jgi:hypothetical protein